MAGCWFSYDQRRRIGKLLTGWRHRRAGVSGSFMTEALKDVPDHPFPVPAGVKFSRMSAPTRAVRRTPTASAPSTNALWRGPRFRRPSRPAAPDNNLGELLREPGTGRERRPPRPHPRTPPPPPRPSRSPEPTATTPTAPRDFDQPSRPRPDRVGSPRPLFLRERRFFQRSLARGVLQLLHHDAF